jgi:hypothetical protein
MASSGCFLDKKDASTNTLDEDVPNLAACWTSWRRPAARLVIRSAAQRLIAGAGHRAASRRHRPGFDRSLLTKGHAARPAGPPPLLTSVIHGFPRGGLEPARPVTGALPSTMRASLS